MQFVTEVELSKETVIEARTSQRSGLLLPKVLPSCAKNELREWRFKPRKRQARAKSAHNSSIHNGENIAGERSHRGPEQPLQ